MPTSPAIKKRDRHKSIILNSSFSPTNRFDLVDINESEEILRDKKVKFETLNQ